jgi:hypothetical protein
MTPAECQEYSNPYSQNYWTNTHKNYWTLRLTFHIEGKPFMNITKNLRLQVVISIVLLNSTFALAQEELVASNAKGYLPSVVTICWLP